MFTGVAAGGGVAAGALLAILFSGGLQVKLTAPPPQYTSEYQRPPPQFFAAEPEARHRESPEARWTAEPAARPIESPEARSSPPPAPEPSASPPESESSGLSASVLSAAAAVGTASLSEGSRLIRRRVRGKQTPSHRDVAVQTEPVEFDTSTASTGSASVPSTPGRVNKRHGRRA